VNATIRVVPVDQGNRQAVLALRVHRAQDDFVGKSADMLASAASGHGSEPMAVLAGDRVIGCYVLEEHASMLTGRPFELPTRALRSLLLDAQAQGHGDGVRAIHAAVGDVAARYPRTRQVALTVNLSNLAAWHAYTKAGFTDSGERYHGGRAGPLALLCRELPIP
jgi:RimJ/RimL family protein N-acetyltransferase